MLDALVILNCVMSGPKLIIPLIQWLSNDNIITITIRTQEGGTKRRGSYNKTVFILSL